jgi:hypothetical protein
MLLQVRFDAPLVTALRANVSSTLAVYNFACQCPHLSCFLHVSTAFVSPSRGKLPIPPDPVKVTTVSTAFVQWGWAT